MRQPPAASRQAPAAKRYPPVGKRYPPVGKPYPPPPAAPRRAMLSPATDYSRSGAPC